jgi:hypothetical protein
MDPEVINEFLGRWPFQPFRIRFSNHDPVDVYNPALVVVTQRGILVANRTRDHFHLYGLMHVVGVEPLRAA